MPSNIVEKSCDHCRIEEQTIPRPCRPILNQTVTVDDDDDDDDHDDDDHDDHDHDDHDLSYRKISNFRAIWSL